MYADDIVLLSESKEGLSECLNKLYIYNKNWCLNINTQKTKVMTFQKGGKTKKLNIKYSNLILEDINEYKYLGTIINKTGNFKQNNTFLKKKGMRASFSLINGLGTNINLSSLIKIFEKVVEPILIYNCEITQAFIPNNWSYSKFKDNIWIQGDQINKVLHSFLRQILGVGKTTSTWGILTETGKYPIIMKIYIQIMKYWVRLLSVKSKYVQEAHMHYIKQWHTNRNSWCKIIDYLLTYTDMKKTFNLEEIISKHKIFIQKFKHKITSKYQNYWKPELNSNKKSKLDFYKTIKKNYYFEQYLDVFDKEKRLPITRIRMSNHNFPIEKMRYMKIKRD